MNGSRRAFLKSVGATAAVAGLPRSAAAIDPIKRRGGPLMTLSLAAYSFRKYLTDYRRRSSGAADDAGSSGAAGAGSMTLEDFVDLCAQYGLPGTEPTSYYVPDPLPDRYLQRLRRRAFLAGLSVSGTAIGNTFTYPAGPDRDREIAYTKLWIDRAADMGAPTIRIFAGNLQKGTTEAQARQWCIEAIRECCEYAGRKGVILALENHGGIVTTADATDLDRPRNRLGVVWRHLGQRQLPQRGSVCGAHQDRAVRRHRANQDEHRGKAGRSAADRANPERHQLSRLAGAGVLGPGGTKDRGAEVSRRAAAPHGRTLAGLTAARFWLS